MARSDVLLKIAWNLPWLVRYPFWRANELLRRLREGTVGGHLILIVANHFEPGYNEEPNETGGYGVQLGWETQVRRVDRWCELARRIGEAVRDHDGTPFRHTNFYPAEQYHPSLLQRIADLQRIGFGEVEVHLHHGIEGPDNADNLRRSLVEFRDLLAIEHRCLSHEAGDDLPRYAFVHGNWALANSAGGQLCGVDSEMEILAETGCYADFTLPSAPDRSQVSRINAIYQCGHRLDRRTPHRSGPSLRVGVRPNLPVLLCGPLVFNWRDRKYGFLPGIENGALTTRHRTDRSRLRLWRGARIAVLGQPDWVFIKLYCHGFFDYDQDAVIGERMREFLQDVLGFAEGSGQFRLHFASAREAFNMAMAAVDGHSGDPGKYRDYRLRQIMGGRR
jgi:hypothetical protein